MPKTKSTRRSPHSTATQPCQTTDPQLPPADRPFAPGYGIVGANDGLGLLPWSWVKGKMESCRTFWLATICPGTENASEARPHVMPVWGVWVNDAFFFSTGRKSRKGQNLVANPSCTVANDDGEEAVIIEGKASVVQDPAMLKGIASVYKKKYKMDPRSMGEPIFKVQPAKVFSFIEKSFPNSATRWRV